ncbi:hypothetical protein HYC85_026111 [Camellia sinensis]|uniref:Uncharacterized protein n=1 Tax=Camellia sinensis TaxID=4442 RepID=A0A7J7G2T0_CAMSI|nr:hypothetical protein HYC85_026111 [Camellia sinensis]
MMIQNVNSSKSTTTQETLSVESPTIETLPSPHEPCYEPMYVHKKIIAADVDLTIDLEKEANIRVYKPLMT